MLLVNGRLTRGGVWREAWADGKWTQWNCGILREVTFHLPVVYLPVGKSFAGWIEKALLFTCGWSNICSNFHTMLKHLILQSLAYLILKVAVWLEWCRSLGTNNNSSSSCIFLFIAWTKEDSIIQMYAILFSRFSKIIPTFLLRRWVQFPFRPYV